MARMMAYLTVSGRLLSRSNNVSRVLLSKPSKSSTGTHFLSSIRSLATATFTFPEGPVPHWRIDDPPNPSYYLKWSDWENPEVYKMVLEAMGIASNRWCVLMDKPEADLSREDLINLYIKTLADVLGCSEEEARMKIYWVSTKCYYGFGALVDKDTMDKFNGLPGIKQVIRDEYEDMEKKAYRGEPFINGEAVPYDPKYHEGWVEPISNDDLLVGESSEDELEVGSYKYEDVVVPPNDLKHWIVNMEYSQFEGLSRDEIINRYIKAAADHIFHCSEEEARLKIYMVSTNNRYAFGVKLGDAFEGYDEQKLNDMLKRIPGVRLECVYPDGFGINFGVKIFRIGEPFDGKEWKTNNNSQIWEIQLNEEQPKKEEEVE